MPVVGIDLGGTKLAAAAFSESGEALERRTVQLGGRGGAVVGRLICDVAIELLRHHDADAVGVCVPGLYRSATGTVWAPNISGWEDYPLRDELRQSAGAGAGVAVDSDRAAYILGETWQGAARGARDAIFLSVGTGIGAGILCNGAVLRGSSDLAGAVGWLALDRPFAARYATHGQFEDQASGPGLVRVASDILATRAGYSGPLRDAVPLDPARIFSACEESDPVALEVVGNAIELWGMAVANLVSAFDPELIVFGGGVFGPALRFLGRIEAVARRWAQPLAMQRVRLVPSALGGDAGLIGAGRLATAARETE